VTHLVRLDHRKRIEEHRRGDGDATAPSKHVRNIALHISLPLALNPNAIEMEK
jgi:hypothetical protein